MVELQGMLTLRVVPRTFKASKNEDTVAEQLHDTQLTLKQSEIDNEAMSRKIKDLELKNDRLEGELVSFACARVLQGRYKSGA